MSGRDIHYHNNDSELLFDIIPNWLSKSTSKVYDSPKKLKGYYASWIFDYKSVLKTKGYDLRTIGSLNIAYYKILLKKWIPNWKAANGYLAP